YCLVGCLWMTKKYDKDVMKNTMRSLCNARHGVRIHDVGNDLFLFMFNNNDDREKVLKLGPWWFDRHILLLDKLDEEKHPSTISLYKAPIWIRVYGIPLLCLSEKVGRIIGNSIGDLEEVQVVTRRRESNQFLKLRVGIDVREPFKKGMKFRVGSVDNIWLTFKYEKLPNFYHFCGKLGHTLKDCESYGGQNNGTNCDIRVLVRSVSVSLRGFCLSVGLLICFLAFMICIMASFIFLRFYSDGFLHKKLICLSVN
ncbi:DUF4283 domain-containing protein/zf-CCHC_4 domain-containing protein, partial [Cephalotus follicularis]